LFGLVCSGGGAVGAYQVGVLKYIHEHFSVDGSSPFKTFAGISCGSLNVVFLAMHSLRAQKDILDLEKLWLDFHVPEYHSDISKKAVRSALKHWFTKKIRKQDSFWSVLDPKPLEEILKRGVDREQFAKCVEKGTTLGLAIAATEIVSGTPVWFMEGAAAIEWDRFHSLGIKTSVIDKHVAASCSVPLLLPPVRIGEHYFYDGGINLARPLSAAIAMGADNILCLRTSIPKSNSLPKYRKNFRPGGRSLFKFILNAVLKDTAYTETEQIGVFNRLFDQIKPYLPSETSEAGVNAVFDERFKVSEYNPINVLSLSPSKSSSEIFKDCSSSIKKIDKRSVPEFMFHRDYIRELIALGYEDAKEDRERLEKFFSTK